MPMRRDRDFRTPLPNHLSKLAIHCRSFRKKAVTYWPLSSCRNNGRIRRSVFQQAHWFQASLSPMPSNSNMPWLTKFVKNKSYIRGITVALKSRLGQQLEYLELWRFQWLTANWLYFNKDSLSVFEGKEVRPSTLSNIPSLDLHFIFKGLFGYILSHGYLFLQRHNKIARCPLALSSLTLLDINLLIASRQQANLSSSLLALHGFVK